MANPNQGDDQDDFEAARDKETGKIKQTGLARTAKLSPFGLAFDEARKLGKKTFEFKGKKYTTEMAKPKPKAAAPADKPAPSKSPADYQKDAEDFKKIAYDSRAKTEGVRDLANRMLGKEKYEAGAMSLPDLETDPGALTGPFKKGGSVKESAMMKKMGRGMTKAAMQKVASKVVKGHEKRMHGMAKGGSVSASKRADGIAIKGKTRGRMV